MARVKLYDGSLVDILEKNPILEFEVGRVVKGVNVLITTNRVIDGSPQQRLLNNVTSIVLYKNKLRFESSIHCEYFEDDHFKFNKIDTVKSFSKSRFFKNS